jgi:hypothetical protein
MADNPLARGSDPVTSHIAADRLKESGKWSTQKGRVLAWMRENRMLEPPGDLSANEMSRESGIPHPVCHKRLPDLEYDGLVKKCRKRTCRVTGELAYTWVLTTPEERAEVLRTRPLRPSRNGRHYADEDDTEDD